MTSAEYLNELRKRLRKLPPAEVEQALSYYEEYFAEVGPEGETELINRLGTPAQVASTIISEYAMKDMSGAHQADDDGQPKQKNSSIKTMWIVIIAVLASPIAIPLAIALFAVVVSFLAAIFSVFLAFFVTALALVISGLAMLVLSVLAIAAQPIEALTMAGISCVAVSVGLALGLGTIKLCQLTVKGVTWVFASILGKKGAKDE